jgi:hypothetical protein
MMADQLADLIYKISQSIKDILVSQSVTVISLADG